MESRSRRDCLTRPIETGGEPHGRIAAAATAFAASDTPSITVTAAEPSDDVLFGGFIGVRSKRKILNSEKANQDSDYWLAPHVVSHPSFRCSRSMRTRPQDVVLFAGLTQFKTETCRRSKCVRPELTDKGE